LKGHKTSGVLRCVRSIARNNGKQSKNNTAVRRVCGSHRLYGVCDDHSLSDKPNEKPGRRSRRRVQFSGSHFAMYTICERKARKKYYFH